MEQLKPCPFCGGESEVCISEEHHGMDGWYRVAFVRCKECRCRTPQYAIDGFYGCKTTEQDAIEAWNRRANDG